MIDSQTVQSMISENMPDAQVFIEGEDGVHFQAVVVDPAFEGMSLIQQHRRVYQALEGKIESQEVHALGLKTMTPKQFEAMQASS